MEFSIIIPLFNEQENLEGLLGSLQRLHYDPDLFETILINNNSTDDTAAKATRFARDGLVLLHENKKGAYAARNKGIASARGKFCCFTDGDCQVDENWLLEAQKIIDEKAPDIIAGKVTQTDPQKNLVSRYDALCFLQQERLVQNNSAATANLVVRKELFDALGKFDERMTTGGDMEFVQRAVRHGYVLLYQEKMIIYHKSRTDFFQVRDKLLRFWHNDYRYPGIYRKTMSLGLLPGARTLTAAFQKRSISGREFLGLLLLSLVLGFSVMANRVKQKLVR